MYTSETKEKVDCLMSAFFDQGYISDIKNYAIYKVLKLVAIKLYYLSINGI